MSWNDHDHRGQYAGERHDHDLDYAGRHHRHYDLEAGDEMASRRITGLLDEAGWLRGQLDDALGRVAALENSNARLAAVLRAAACGYEKTRVAGPGAGCDLAVAAELAAAFAVFAAALGEDRAARPRMHGDLGPDPQGHGDCRANPCPYCATSDEPEPGAHRCPETSDGEHCGDWHDGGRCCACGQSGPGPEDGPGPQEHGPGPEAGGEGAMPGYRYLLPEDDGPDPDRPKTWLFGEAPETTGWHDVPDPEKGQP